eukprot:1032069-Prymnesium_polylepis.1
MQVYVNAWSGKTENWCGEKVWRCLRESAGSVCAEGRAGDLFCPAIAARSLAGGMGCCRE